MEPTWVALATERLGQPFDQWLIAHAATGRSYRWITSALADEAGVTVSRESIRQRTVMHRALIEQATAAVAAELADHRSAAATRAAQELLAAS